MSEWSAALGLLQLKYFDEAIAARKRVDGAYRKALANVRGIRCLTPPANCVLTYAYFPILIDGDYVITRDELYRRLKDRNVHPRRYFYPLISDFPMYRGLPSAERANLPVANKIAREVLCLPIYPALEATDIDRITQIIRDPLAFD